MFNHTMLSLASGSLCQSLCCQGRLILLDSHKPSFRYANKFNQTASFPLLEPACPSVRCLCLSRSSSILGNAVQPPALQTISTDDGVCHWQYRHSTSTTGVDLKLQKLGNCALLSKGRVLSLGLCGPGSVTC